MKKRLLVVIIFCTALVSCIDTEEPSEDIEPEADIEPENIEPEAVEPEEAAEPEETVEPEDTEIVTSEEYDVIIVGAGISGLSAAYMLRDYNIKVLEKNETVGGRIISGSYGGFTYAKGAEYIGKPEGLLKEMIRELGVKLREIPSPMDAHYYNKKFYYGEDALTLMFIEHSSLNEYNDFVSTILELYDEYAWLPEFDEDSEGADLDYMTAREWFLSQEFPPIFADRYNVAARGLFGASIDEISALSFIPEIAFDYVGFEPIKDTDDLEIEPVKGAIPTGAYSFETGITELTDALAHYLGDVVQVNSTVTRVQRTGNEYLVIYEDSQGNTHTLRSHIVILAVPAPIALKLAPSLLSDEQKEVLEQISYSSYATVALFSKTPIFDEAFDLAVPDNLFFTDVYDATWIERYYSTESEDSPYFIISVYCAPQSYKDRSILFMSDEELLNNIYRDLEKIFPEVSQKVIGADIERFPYAYPVMVPGAYHQLSRLHKITTGRLLLAGDYMIYPTLEGAVESGEIAAEEALKELRSRKRTLSYTSDLLVTFNAGLVFCVFQKILEGVQSVT